MDKLYAPWRSIYIAQATGHRQHLQGCVFCASFDDGESFAERFILYKNEHLIILLNLYPYNAGHLLIVPAQHVGQLDGIAPEVNNALMQAIVQSTAIVQQALGCAGVNIGMNLGLASGAGIPDHLHWHVVPRFAGDINFFAVIGNTKQISVDLSSIYKTLKPYFDKATL